MKLNDLLQVAACTQAVEIHGNCLGSPIQSDAETLCWVLGEEVLNMRIVDVEAENSALKIWIEVGK